MPSTRRSSWFFRFALLTLGLFAAGWETNLLVFGQVTDPETSAIKPFVTDPSACRSCHPEGDHGPYAREPWRTCTEFCLTCHKEPHHSVKIVLPRKWKSKLELPLSSKGEIVCGTCHDLTTPRYDRQPWRSASLFGRVFQRSSKHKTYYLLARNDQGQLCRKCH